MSERVERILVKLRNVSSLCGSYVYLIQCNEGPVKIGKAIDPAKRLHTISSTNAYECKLIGLFRGDLKIETMLHKEFKDAHLHHEWFSDIPDILELASFSTILSTASERRVPLRIEREGSQAVVYEMDSWQPIYKFDSVDDAQKFHKRYHRKSIKEIRLGVLEAIEDIN